MEFSGIMHLFIETIRGTIAIDTSYRRIFNAIVKSTNTASREFDTTEFVKLLSTAPDADKQDSIRWKFWLPANLAIQRASQRWRPVIAGQRFDFVSSVDHINSYAALVNDAPYQVKIRCRNHSRVTQWPGFILFDAHGPTCAAAFRSIEKSFHIARGIVELMLGGGTYSHSFPARPPRKIELESWAIAQSERGDIDYVGFNWAKSSFSDIVQLSSPVKIEEKHILATLRFKRALKSTEPQHVSNLVEKSLIQFIDAIDQLLPTDQLLHLWQIAETITLASRHGGNTDTVCKRFAHHFKYVETTEEDAFRVVKTIARLRNSMVHQGDSEEITERLISEFKVECCRAIWWLRWRCDDIRTVDRLEWWYSLRTLPDHRLDNCREIAGLILSDR